MRNLIQGAQDAIQGITQPFRNHIGSTETVAAMDACEKLQRALSEVDSEEEGEDKVADATNLRDLVVNIDADELQLILNNYVDAVVVPTYKALREKYNTLKEAVDAFAANPTNAGFVACSKAWMEAREPWETSEAFLFGPVDEYGLDPNMDSWPLDQDAIVQIMKSQKWADSNGSPATTMPRLNPLRTYAVSTPSNSSCSRTASPARCPPNNDTPKFPLQNTAK